MSYKERILVLLSSILEEASNEEEKKEDAEFLEMALNSFPHYFNEVVTGELQMMIQKYRLEGEDYRLFVMETDRRRKIAHDAMMGFVAVLNRLSRKLGLDPIYNGDEQDRWAVADFCEEFCCDIFSHRYSGKGSAFADKQTMPEFQIDRFLSERG